MRRWTVLIVVVLACDGRGTAQPDAAPPRPIALELLAEHHAQRVCEVEQRCCDAAERNDESVSDCVIRRRDGLERIEATIRTAVDRGTASYDGAAMASCLENYYAGGCVSRSRYQSVWGPCLATIAGALPDGAACELSFDCASGYCRTGFVPGNDVPEPIECAPLPDAGDECPDLICTDQAWCSLTDLQCISRAPDGALCAHGFECESGICGGRGCGLTPYTCDGV